MPLEVVKYSVIVLLARVVNAVLLLLDAEGQIGGHQHHLGGGHHHLGNNPPNL